MTGWEGSEQCSELSEALQEVHEAVVVRHRTDNRGEIERIQPARLDTRTGYLRSLAYGMPRLIGDPERDAELLERASPLKRVAELKAPVLLVHGLLDRRVPYEHMRKFAGAARNAGVKVEEVTYPAEGHGGFDPGNHAD